MKARTTKPVRAITREASVARRKEEPPVDVTLPITPMLDMSFQLLSFFVVTFENLKSRETREVDERARQWLHDNAPTMEAHGTGPPVMFSHIAKRNIEMF